MDLEDAKVGILGAALGSTVLTWTIFRFASRLPDHHRARALLGSGQSIVDLAVPVDPARDHLRGAADGSVTVVEYGDFQCPFCGQVERVLRELMEEYGDLRFVWRHLPLTDVHPQARLAAEAAEAAGRQGAFWEMHDRLLEHQGAFERAELLGHAQALGLDVDRFRQDLDGCTGSGRIAEDIHGADLSGVVGTPTLLIDGRRYDGALDAAAVSNALRTARLRNLARRHGRSP